MSRPSASRSPDNPSREDQFAEAFTEVHELAERMLSVRRTRLTPHLLRNRHRHGVFDCSPAQQVDTIVLEVGMGGRLDATNVVDPGALGNYAHRLRSPVLPR